MGDATLPSDYLQAAAQQSKLREKDNLQIDAVKATRQQALSFLSKCLDKLDSGAVRPLRNSISRQVSQISVRSDC